MPDYLKQMQTLVAQSIQASTEYQKAKIKGDTASMERAKRAREGISKQFNSIRTKLRTGK